MFCSVRMLWKPTFLMMVSALVLVPTMAVAQAPPSPATPQAPTAPPVAHEDRNCVPTQPAPRDGTIAPRGQTTGQSREPLSDRLAKSDGVLCPPTGVDPEMRAPTPEGGNTPVIPPPGGPGGDPSLRPK